MPRTLATILLVFVIAAALLLGSTDLAAQERPLENEVVFTPLTLDDPVTCMDMSEDGKYLAFSHQGESKVSIYDVLNKSVIASWDSPSPRSILWRNGRVIVGNKIEGTIHVYSQSKDWKSAGELRVPKPGIAHISAAQGRNYKNELIVTCHGEGTSASYQDSMIFVVNASSGRFKPISKAALASVSYDGRILIVQESFNLSSYGQITAYNYSEFLHRSGDARVLFKGGSRHQTPFAYQVTPGGYWIGGNKVFGGIPLTQLGDDMGDIVIADGSEKMVYSLTKEMITAHQLNAAMTHINSRRVQYPKQYAQDTGMLFNKWIDREYLLDHPVGYTHGDRTYLFLRPVKGGLVFAAEMPTFGATKSSSESIPARPAKPATTHPDEASSVKVQPLDPSIQKARSWTTADGDFRVEAVLVQFSDAAVVLRRSDNGKLIVMPPTALSQSDRDHLNSLE
ncbi:MAG: hypothetical protein HKN47_24945 [Pirellulaceae bacterium]|nr:hypothetical protein [Pirellulaceae bacterium]